MRSVMVVSPWFAEKRLQSLDDDRHIWSEVSFILNTQCCNCCHLNVTNTYRCMCPQNILDTLGFQISKGGKYQEGIKKFLIRLHPQVASKLHFNPQVERKTMRYLCNSFWWIIIVQLRIHALLNFVFAQPWSCLYHHIIRYSMTAKKK